MAPPIIKMFQLVPKTGYKKRTDLPKKFYSDIFKYFSYQTPKPFLKPTIAETIDVHKIYNDRFVKFLRYICPLNF